MSSKNIYKGNFHNKKFNYSVLAFYRKQEYFLYNSMCPHYVKKKIDGKTENMVDSLLTIYHATKYLHFGDDTLDFNVF